MKDTGTWVMAGIILLLAGVLVWSLSRMGKMGNNNNILYLIPSIVSTIFVIVFFAFKGCDVQPKVTESKTREMKAGIPDTVTVVKTDTVTVVKKVQEKVFVPVDRIIRFGADSSRIDTSIVMKDSVKVHFAGTTFPAIDSLNFDISVETPLREILREVTNTIKQTDTLTIKEVIEVPGPWYDRFWVGAVTVITVILSVVGFL